MWHCPSCGTPQAETARCWVCHKSSTTCSTCRHFRASLSAEVGWCASDPKRRPLTGREQRGCWQGRPAAEPAPADGGGPSIRRPRQTPDVDDQEQWPAHLDFIPVDLLGSIARSSSEGALLDDLVPGAAASLPPVMLDRDEGWADRTSLFGEPEA